MAGLKSLLVEESGIHHKLDGCVLFQFLWEKTVYQGLDYENLSRKSQFDSDLTMYPVIKVTLVT